MDGSRNSAQNASRRLSGNAPSSKNRVPSANLDDAELRPSDSASNAPTRRSTSQSHKMNPAGYNSVGRQTERTSINTKETFRIRTKTATKDGGVTELPKANGSQQKASQAPYQETRVNGFESTKKGKKPQSKAHTQRQTKALTDRTCQEIGSLRPRWLPAKLPH